MYTRSAIEALDTSALDDAAAHWSAVATRWEDSHDKLVATMRNPGGMDWEGATAEAARAHAYALRSGAMVAIDALHAGAAIATAGASELEWGKQQVHSAVSAATEDGFNVGEDFSVTDTTGPATVTRQGTAQAHRTAISSAVSTLADTDNEVAADLTSKTAAIQMVDWSTAPSAVDQNGHPVDTSSGKLPPPPVGKEWHYYLGWGYRLEDPLQHCSEAKQFWLGSGIGASVATLPLGGLGTVAAVPGLGLGINDLEQCEPGG